jgi:drug/metabolite transporter (DMT)-like permease
MKFIYKIPGYLLLLFGGFCLSWGGLIVRSFDTSSAWEILLLRSFFFFLGVSTFLLLIYKKNSFTIIKKAGFVGLLGGFIMSFSFIAFVFAMMNASVANVVFIISTQTMFLALFGYLYLKENISLIGLLSIILAMAGITIMISDSITGGTLFGNLVALTIPISFSILVMIVRKNSNLDLVPAIWYASIFSVLYSLIMIDSFSFTNNDLLMGFLLGVPQLTFGFICITIGSRTTKSVTIGLLMLTETIFAPLWVWLFLNEIPPLSVFVGGTIIIFAIIIKSLDKNKFNPA